MGDIYELTTDLISKHLENKNVSRNNDTWEIKKSEICGRGIFALRDIAVGEIIFADSPVILGPRAAECGNMCATCYKNVNLYPCTRTCGNNICSADCENSPIHIAECAKINEWRTEKTQTSQIITKCLAPIRSLFLNESDVVLIKYLAAHTSPQHGIEIDLLKSKLKLNIPEEEESLMRLVCAVLDANAYEVLPSKDSPTLRGLYPLSSIMNHSCAPNTMHVFDQKQTMIVRATVPIKKGTEICSSYSRLIWGTLSRRYHLMRTKHFLCRCSRCTDRTEYGTYLNAILCSQCGKLVLPKYTNKSTSEWECISCKSSVAEDKVGFIMRVMADRMNQVRGDPNEMLNFYQGNIAKILPESNQILVEVKYAIIWSLGYDDGFLYADLSEGLLDVKEQYCYDILELLKKLNVGMCKMRGLILHELFQCKQERHRKYLKNVDMNNNYNVPAKFEYEMEMLLQEAANIFLYDVAAPTSITEYWRKNEINLQWNK